MHMYIYIYICIYIYIYIYIKIAHIDILLWHTHTIHVWYKFYGFPVGKYTIPMDGMGYIFPRDFWRFFLWWKGHRRHLNDVKNISVPIDLRPGVRKLKFWS